MFAETVEVIEIDWEGPYPVQRVIAEAHGGADYGIYQLYGTHTVHGPDSLLYIGRTQQRTFAQRIAEHNEEWCQWEASAISAYLGRLGAVTPMSQQNWPQWEEAIARAERLLIYSCSPPYNSSGLKTYVTERPTVILNHRRRHRLPPEVSTLMWSSKIATAAWRRFGERA